MWVEVQICLKRTPSIVNQAAGLSTGNNQPCKKACCGISNRVHPYLLGLTSGSHSRLFSELIVTGTVNI